MHHLRLITLLLFVNFMTMAWADTTTKLRGPKQFDAPVVTRVGPLSTRDTLWRISEQVRPDPRLNMYQVMYALYLKNPSAFIDDNFNHLQPGAFLDVPSMQEILAVNAQEAQRKSENDDRIWAEKIRTTAAVKPEETAARQQDVAKATEAITEELNRVELQQTEQMLDIRERLAASMVNVESIVVENIQLKKQLDTVVAELGAVKSQVDQDSQIQQQLTQLLQQTNEMLEQQREQIRKAEEGFNFAETWQKLASSNVIWILAASLPAAIFLLTVVLLIRRRGQKAAAVVSAATAAPTVDPNYRSPLPPLDDSLDFDESSLISLDDSLLSDSMGGGIRLDDDAFAAPKQPAARKASFEDDLLDDAFAPPLPEQSAADFDLDDLLDEPDIAASTVAKTEFDANNILSDDDLSSLFSNMEAEPEFEAKTEFDPKNILSDDDLSSLFSNLEAEDENPDDIFAQAQAQMEQAPAAEEDDILTHQPLSPDALQQAAAQADELEELLEEIELDLPVDDEDVHITLDDEEFDIDALVAQTQAAPVAKTVDIQENLQETVTDVEDIDAMLAAFQPSASIADAAEVVPDEVDDILLAEEFEPAALELEQSSPSEKAALFPDDEKDEAGNFDSSELDAFAESLAEETVAEPLQFEEPVSDAVDHHELITEMIEQEEDLHNELELILSEVAEIRAQSQQISGLDALNLPQDALELAAADFAESELKPEDMSLLLAEPEQNTEDFIPSDSADVDMSEQELAAEFAAESEYLTEFAELQDDSVVAVMPDLAEVDDNSVTRLFESISSVERPSKMLDEYPELQISEDAELEQDLIFPDDDDLMLADAQYTQSTAMDTAIAADPDLLSELDELEQSNFDALLSEIEQADESELPSVTVADKEQRGASALLAESMPEATAPLDIPEYVHIDKLLAASEEEDTPTPADFTMDVDREEVTQILEGNELTDVDKTDAGFAGHLDLIRAYLEMDDAEQAHYLISQVLKSDAPAHVKQEAMDLQQQIS